MCDIAAVLSLSVCAVQEPELAPFFLPTVAGPRGVVFAPPTAVDTPAAPAATPAAKAAWTDDEGGVHDSGSDSDSDSDGDGDGGAKKKKRRRDGDADTAAVKSRVMQTSAFKSPRSTLGKVRLLCATLSCGDDVLPRGAVCRSVMRLRVWQPRLMRLDGGAVSVPAAGASRHGG